VLAPAGEDRQVGDVERVARTEVGGRGAVLVLLVLVRPHHQQVRIAHAVGARDRRNDLDADERNVGQRLRIAEHAHHALVGGAAAVDDDEVAGAQHAAQFVARDHQGIARAAGAAVDVHQQIVGQLPGGQLAHMRVGDDKEGIVAQSAQGTDHLQVRGQRHRF